MVLCAGCEQKIESRQYLTCSFCKKYYDTKCANLQEDQYLRMNSQTKLLWECPECKCKKPKNINANTPIRQQTGDITLNCTPDANVTLRRKQSQNNASIYFEETSPLGNTLCQYKNIESGSQSTLTLQNLSELISEKLKENNMAIISELRSTIQMEINKAISKLKEDFKQDTDALLQKNEDRRAEINKINDKIEMLQRENIKLQNEIKSIQYKTSAGTGTGKHYNQETNAKKFVIYGLREIYKESENELYDRICNLFWDILGVDLSGFIEETFRIGRYNRVNRPLVVELMSKRTTKYICENSRYFQGTGITVSEFLDEDARKQRKQLRDRMLIARNKGQHAIIRNNKLYIEGELIIEDRENGTRQHPSSTQPQITPTRIELHNGNSYGKSELMDDDQLVRRSSESYTFRTHNTKM
ncbi:unnamed protein product [Spodoptera littoralis]|uniref:Zinc finger PHD-type domain-containing protein n=1 Tax=Spodoptera littoralis TaxID=7109 RepID=A0A9P0IH45_SPOLI|nr:unnamed protein product [Spodoptera littoralis]CAH1646846.1 unnamed protein product [Spodoptera littoralis]